MSSAPPQAASASRKIKSPVLSPSSTVLDTSLSPDRSSQSQDLSASSGFCGMCRGEQWQSKTSRLMTPVLTKLNLTDVEKMIFYKHVIKKATKLETEARKNQLRGSRLDSFGLWGGILTTGLIMVRDSTHVVSGGFSPILFWIVISLSVLVNIAVSTQQLYNFLQMARIYDDAYTEIDHAVWEYFGQAGVYAGKSHADSFPAIIEHVNNVYRNMASSLRDAKAKAQQSVKHAIEDALDAKELVQHSIDAVGNAAEHAASSARVFSKDEIERFRMAFDRSVTPDAVASIAGGGGSARYADPGTWLDGAAAAGAIADAASGAGAIADAASGAGTGGENV
jgi:hypothetical protein